MTKTLIEKLETAKNRDPHQSYATIARNAGVADAIAIVREHEAEQPAASAEAVERVARAIYGVFPECNSEGEPVAWDKLEASYWQETYRGRARAAIAAMADGSATLAPVVAESDPQLTPATQEPDQAFPMGAIENGRAFIDRLEAHYSFEDDGRSLASNVEWDELKRCFEYMSDYLVTRPVCATGSAPPSPASVTRPSESQGGDIYPSVVAEVAAGEAYRRATEAVKDMVVAHHMSHAPACDSSHWKDVFEDASTDVLAVLPALMPSPVSLTEEGRWDAMTAMLSVQGFDGPVSPRVRLEAALTALLERFELRRREP